MPLVRFAGKKCSKQAIRGSSGSPPARRGSVSRSGAEPLSACRPPGREGPGSSSSLRALFRVPSLALSRRKPKLSQLAARSRLPRLPTTCQGSSALPTTSPARVHFPRGLPVPRYVPSSGVLSLSTVYSALRLCRLVPSRSRVQGTLSSRGFSLRAASPPRRRCSAPLPFGSRPLR